ncbi:Lipase member H, partial [Folsomia candida]
ADPEQDSFYYIDEDDGNKTVQVYLTKAPNTVSSMLESDIHFYLYTRRSPAESKLSMNTSNGNWTNFDINSPTKFLVHGFLSSYDSKDFPQGAKNAYVQHFNQQNVNLILVDWKKGARLVVDSQGFKFYGNAAENTNVVANQVVKFITWMINNGKAKLEDMHFIGHSLGAQTCGIASDRFSKANPGGGKFTKITALDPALPCFGDIFSNICNILVGAKNEDRLSPDDADVVHVIHSNPSGFGVYDPVGTADFYLNGVAPVQPGCFPFFIIIKGVLIPVPHSTCSHSRAHQVLTVSIDKSMYFKACTCANMWNLAMETCECQNHIGMGEYTSR